jgi:hypothetical protein
MPGVVHELFVVEKQLLARRKYEFGAAVHTFQYAIGEFHGRLASQGISPKSAVSYNRFCRSRFPVHFPVPQQGPGPLLKVERLSRITANSAKQFRIQHNGRLLKNDSHFSGLCGVQHDAAQVYGGMRHLAANASIDRNRKGVTFLLRRRAVPFRLSINFGGFRLSLSKAAGTVVVATGEEFSPALCEPFCDSACAPKLP